MTRTAGPRGSSASCSPTKLTKKEAARRRPLSSGLAVSLVAGFPALAKPPRRRRRAGHGRLVLLEAGQALRTQLRIVDRPALAAHPRVAEAHAGLQQPVVALTGDDIAPRRPVAEITPAGPWPNRFYLRLNSRRLGIVLRLRRRHRCQGQAGSREGQARRGLVQHDR